MTGPGEFEAIAAAMPDVWRTSAMVSSGTFLAELREIIGRALTVKCGCPECVHRTPEETVFWCCHHAISRFRESADDDAMAWVLVAALAELHKVAPTT